MSDAVIIHSTPASIAVSRTATRESVNTLPAVMADLLEPYRLVLEAMEFSSGVPLEPSVQAVVDAYPVLLSLLEEEVGAYVKAYSDKCGQLEDEVLSLRMHLHRLMRSRGAK